MEMLFALAAAVVVAVSLGIELRFFAPQRAPGRREAMAWASGWLLFSLAVAAGIALADGPAGDWATVYLIERSLSLDNVFLFSLLLAYFLVPPELRGRAIAIGIAGALLLRALAISAGGRSRRRRRRRALRLRRAPALCRLPCSAGAARGIRPASNRWLRLAPHRSRYR